MIGLNDIMGIVLMATTLAALFVVYRRDLMMLQQNSYRDERYFRWFEQSGESTSVWRILSLIAALFVLVNRLPFFAGAAVATIVMVWQFVALLCKKYKKPLVMTARATRIYCVMWALTVAVVAVFGVTLRTWTALCCSAMACAVVSPLILIGANLILRPVEKKINRGYYDDAAAILAGMPELKIIGITGSFGKTSAKHYLHRILSEQFATAMTPGSYNTTLGVVRTIREYLKPYDEVFIVEMGAKQPGDIKEICDLVHPEIGILTAVGEQHLESFKSIENVQRTKFELIDSLPADGLAVLNNDFPYVANREVSNVETLRYAVDPATKQAREAAAYVATDITYGPQGTQFTISGEGHHLRLQTRLVGECNISNLMAAVIVALRLGVDEQKIRYAVDQIEQVEHRLNMKRTPGGITIIDDAFNSNPTGSAMALDVLGSMTGGKRIVVTPGMIELGDKQYEANEALGEKCGNCADVVILVGHYNREPLSAGAAKGKIAKEDVHTVDTFAEAQRLLQTMLAPGDTVLYENDLPDSFK